MVVTSFLTPNSRGSAFSVPGRTRGGRGVCAEPLAQCLVHLEGPSQAGKPDRFAHSGSFQGPASRWQRRQGLDPFGGLLGTGHSSPPLSPAPHWGLTPSPGASVCRSSASEYFSTHPGRVLLFLFRLSSWACGVSSLPGPAVPGPFSAPLHRFSFHVATSLAALSLVSVSLPVTLSLVPLRAPLSECLGA